MNFLVDYNFEGHALLLAGKINSLDSSYRDRCVDRLIAIVVDMDDYRGSRWLYIP